MFFFMEGPYAESILTGNVIVLIISYVWLYKTGRHYKKIQAASQQARSIQTANIYISMSRQLITGIFFLLFFSACTPSAPEIEGFEPYVWQRDKWGCNQERAAMLPLLEEAKDQILGLRETELIRLLGKADEQELYERSQKFLVYYLEPGAKCEETEDSPGRVNALHVRINSIGITNEMFVRPK